MNEIVLDLKKNNFVDTANTNNNDFYKGTINGGSDKILKAAMVNASDNKVNIEIPNVKVEDNVWLRLAPNGTDDTNGYYAQISNLKVSIESN